ncbi:MAG: hypothetical protein CM1200mP39_26890 [Dehalococcoidia bacterium]|nr:MAG: hypothetical protein CM1200mP39_26890 [Dehalococcoidia bacterium]
MKVMKLLAAAAVMTGMAFAGTSTAVAESTLDIVKKRGHLRCQVGQPSPGFYNLEKTATGMAVSGSMSCDRCGGFG